MSTRRRITATLDDRVVIFTGWRVAELLKEAGTKPIYAGSAGGWMIDRHRLGDVLAYLEQRNIAVSRHDEPTYRPREVKVQNCTSDGDVVDAEGGGLW